MRRTPIPEIVGMHPGPSCKITATAKRESLTAPLRISGTDNGWAGKCRYTKTKTELNEIMMYTKMIVYPTMLFMKLISLICIYIFKLIHLNIVFIF